MCVYVCVVVYTYSNYMYLHTYVHTSLLDIIPGDCVIIIRMLVMYGSGIYNYYICMGTHYVQYNSVRYKTSDIVCDCQKHCIYSMYVLPPSNGVHACYDTQQHM